MLVQILGKVLLSWLSVIPGFHETVKLLGQASGYGVLVGVGGLFALGIVVATKLSSRYLNENSQSTEMFMVAGRRVGVGLTASAVYSSWTWSTEFLMVTTMVFNYGVMASFWFGVGLCFQICLMSLLGIEAKKKIPASHTCLEIVQLRYGKACHLLYLFLCLVNNILSCSSMILAAAGAISVIAGNMHIVACTMLIPFGVLLYTTVGGLKSTFLTDYVHSFVVLVVMCYAATSVLTSPEIGGMGGLYDKVIAHDADRYVKGNFQGSFMTGKSQGAVFFGIILSIGNTGLTVMDSSFWQKSFSADLDASVPGYLLAAGTIFANVWPIGTIIGLAGIVLESTSIFPTYPRLMTAHEVNSGFVLPYTLKALLGDRALGAVLLVVYLAVTSTTSAQMISVSSIISFDIYKKYIKPDANNKHLINVSHLGVVFFGLFSAGFSVMLHYVGTDMTWMTYFYSMVICPGVIPLVLAITWDGQTRLAFFVAPIVGMLAGIAVWLSTAYHYFGAVTIFTTGQQLPCLFGGLTSIILPGIASVVISLTINPYKFDWDEFKKAEIIVVDPEESLEESRFVLETASNEKNEQVVYTALDPETPAGHSSFENSFEGAETSKQKKLNFYIKISRFAVVFVFLLTWVVWPMPLYRDWIWSKAFFKGWTTVSIFWLYLAFVIIGLYPLYDGRHSLAKVGRGIYRDFIVRDGKSQA
ncbi:hypothetical protein BABINDRAFT_182060 [Babjeviella inositovora NRRL Y-12698]|uniref:Urea active transporter n=1 Tax=Babjeviella inositovora NRRL Y-12698 TaxID=984486 RepID=A0A1E3QXZ7_9ASCO|nr:uncharacterized protein BABINDRAFT_182060 [Babjeviella inositovora NRRL Y-12698]ODQ82539.1 hypothetical protein BABINDRAFT_182060 [Babjeviella inositovora NRRL Y-12698]